MYVKSGEWKGRSSMQVWEAGQKTSCQEGRKKSGQIKQFPVWFRNQLILSRLEPVLSHTEKSCIVSYPVFYEYKNVQL